MKFNNTRRKILLARPHLKGTKRNEAARKTALLLGVNRVFNTIIYPRTDFDTNIYP